MKTDYIRYCEDLWSDWLDERLHVSSAISDRFDLNAAPEPYLTFDTGKRPLVALLTNPGKTMPHQNRHAVQRGEGPLSRNMKYAAAAASLGRYYRANLKGAPLRRINSLREVSKLAKFHGVIGVETCPFHSARLPGKPRLVRLYRDDEFLANYYAVLQTYLKDRPAIIVSAVATNKSLSRSATLSPWLVWQARLAGLQLERAKFVPLVTKERKTTSAAFVAYSRESPKALVLMMGGNHLPGESGRQKVAGLLHR